MSPQEFQTQVNRLSDTFGAHAYKTERTKMLWQDVRDFDAKWFEKLVGGLIASSRQAPLPNDFADAISWERERLWKIEKAQNSEDAKDWGKYAPEDKRTICAMIQKRMAGGVKDEEWGQFVSVLKGATP